MGHTGLLTQNQIFLKAGQKRIIAIDGPARVGKHTTASKLAQEFDFVHIDSGAIYRAVTLLAHEQGINFDDRTEVNCYSIAGLAVRVTAEMLLEQKLHSDFVSMLVPKIASMPHVRSRVREMQFRLSSKNTRGAVVEGRDIATNVFPEAQIKLFLTASVKVRAQREMSRLGSVCAMSFEQICEAITERDRLDLTREIDPLMIHPEAYIIDNSDLDPDQVHERVLCHIGSRYANF